MSGVAYNFFCLYIIHEKQKKFRLLRKNFQRSNFFFERHKLTILILATFWPQFLNFIATSYTLKNKKVLIFIQIMNNNAQL